jgi:hypothetical protein
MALGSTQPLTEMSTSHIRDTGAVHSFTVHHGGRRNARTVDVEEHILRRVEENSHTTVRRIQAAKHVKRTTVGRDLHEQLLNPYPFQQIQALRQLNLRPR